MGFIYNCAIPLNWIKFFSIFPVGVITRDNSSNRTSLRFSKHTCSIFPLANRNSNSKPTIKLIFPMLQHRRRSYHENRLGERHFFHYRSRCKEISLLHNPLNHLSTKIRQKKKKKKEREITAINAIAWIVLPNPMSSAKIPPLFLAYKVYMNLTPIR